MAYYVIDGKKVPYLNYDIDSIIDKLEKGRDIKKNEITWEDYLKLSKELKEIENLPKIVNSTISFSKDKAKLGSQMSKVLEYSNSAVDNEKETKEFVKHVLIERLVIKDEYEFNFTDLETKEFYWSYYTSDRNYNVAKKAFENVFKHKGVKYYLEE